MNQQLQSILPDSVYCEVLIVCTKKRRGDGKSTPIRIITEVFTKQGELVAENDPETEKMKFTEKDVIDFAKYVKDEYKAGIGETIIISPQLLSSFLKLKRGNH